MKALLEQYAAYNIWANELLTEKFLSLPDTLQNQEMPSSFPSLHLTITHMLQASSIWWQRLKMQEIITKPGAEYSGNASGLVAAFLHQERLWLRWIEEAKPEALEEIFHYENFKKEKFQQPIFELLLHLFNHATYHRGQLVTMFRNLSVDNIPATDFIVYCRIKK